MQGISCTARCVSSQEFLIQRDVPRAFWIREKAAWGLYLRKNSKFSFKKQMRPASIFCSHLNIHGRNICSWPSGTESTNVCFCAYCCLQGSMLNSFSSFMRQKWIVLQSVPRTKLDFSSFLLSWTLFTKEHHFSSLYFLAPLALEFSVKLWWNCIYFSIRESTR